MFLTVSLSGWHKEVAQNIPVADPSVTPKALEVSSFVGLLLCLALVHGSLLLFEEGCERFGADCLRRTEPPVRTLDPPSTFISASTSGSHGPIEAIGLWERCSCGAKN
jgi:hypothetical protein